MREELLGATNVDPKQRQQTVDALLSYALVRRKPFAHGVVARREFSWWQDSVPPEGQTPSDITVAGDSERNIEVGYKPRLRQSCLVANAPLSDED